MGLGDFRNKTVEITSLGVPESPRVGQDVSLTCRFKLGGSDHRLYTVNWWRGKDQFYTYKGDTAEPKHAYTFDGIQVKEDGRLQEGSFTLQSTGFTFIWAWGCNWCFYYYYPMEASTAETVVLEGVSEATSGVFKCEVMGEGPSFRTAVKTKYMGVVVPPRLVEIHAQGQMHPPRFRSGEAVMLNCTARGSKPKAKLMWELNGIPVRENNLYVYGDSRDKSGHVTSTLGIRWRAPDHFYDGVARVTCRAAVASFSMNATQLVYLDQSSSSPYNHRYYSAGSQSQVTGALLHLVTLLVGRSLQ